MPGTICHLAEPVNRQTAQTQPLRRDHDRVGRQPGKKADDLEAEARIRAHLKEAMDTREIDQTELARRLDVDDGDFSRKMRRERGFSVGLVLRICDVCQINPTRLLQENPPAKYWDVDPVPAPRTGRRRG